MNICQRSELFLLSISYQRNRGKIKTLTPVVFHLWVETSWPASPDWPTRDVPRLCTLGYQWDYVQITANEDGASQSAGCVGLEFKLWTTEEELRDTAEALSERRRGSAAEEKHFWAKTVVFCWDFIFCWGGRGFPLKQANYGALPRWGKQPNIT